MIRGGFTNPVHFVLLISDMRYALDICCCMKELELCADWQWHHINIIKSYKIDRQRVADIVEARDSKDPLVDAGIRTVVDRLNRSAILKEKTLLVAAALSLPSM